MEKPLEATWVGQPVEWSEVPGNPQGWGAVSLIDGDRRGPANCPRSRAQPGSQAQGAQRDEVIATWKPHVGSS